MNRYLDGVKMSKFEEMTEKYPRGMLVLRGLVMLASATIISILLISPLYFFDIDALLLIAIFTSPTDLIPLPFNLIGIPLMPIGLLLIVWANYTLLHIGKIGLRAREPMQTPSNLVVAGPYRYSRNPLYLGALIALLGLVIVWSSLIVFLGVIFVYIVFRYVFIRKEELILEDEFGNEYRDFLKRIRRWL